MRPLLLIAFAGCVTSSPEPSTQPGRTVPTPQPRGPTVRDDPSPQAPGPRANSEPTRPRAPAPEASDEVVLYVSRWCSYCDAVRKQLSERGVPHVERDIFDERWRAEYVEHMRTLGHRPPAVPLLVYRDLLVLGLDNIAVVSIANYRDGSWAKREQEHPGATTPPSTYLPIHEPGGAPLPEPPDTPVVLYGNKYCDWCPAARKFLRDKHVRFVEHDVDRSPGREELEALMASFHLRGPSVPCFEAYGRNLMGLDTEGIEAILEWRRTVKGAAGRH